MTPDDLAAIRERDHAPIAGETWWGHYQAAAQDRRALLAEVDRLAAVVEAARWMRERTAIDPGGCVWAEQDDLWDALDRLDGVKK